MSCYMSVGARSAVAFQYSNTIPHPSTLTYEGLFCENYFKLQNKATDSLLDIELSHAQVISPITNKLESWLGVLPKSKFDGIGLREPIDISVSLDISGSMTGQRLELAKSACLKLFPLLNAQDNIAFSTFDTQAYRIFPLTQGDKISMEHKEAIKAITTKGCTTIYNALKDSYDILSQSQSNNKHRRIIMITDMEDNCKDDRLIELMKQSANEGIYVTFIGISYTCNTSLTEALSHVRGSNYFVANKNEEVEKYLVNDFKFICFPSATNVELEFRSSDLKAIKCIGTGFNIPKEHSDKDTQWLTQSHKYQSDEFKAKINHILMYFNRLKKKVPLPVLASMSNFLRYDKKTVCEINTVFPSGIEREGDNEVYVEGGMMLIKLQKQIIACCNGYSCELKLKYTSNDGEDYCKRYNVNFPQFTTQNEMYSDQNIKNALSLNYYVKYCKSIMKAENYSVNNKDKDKLKRRDDMRKMMVALGDKIKLFMKSNMNEYYTKDNLMKCSNKIEELVELVNKKIEFEREDEKDKSKQNEKPNIEETLHDINYG